MANLYNARLGTDFVTDPHVSFMNYLKNNWNITAPAAAQIKFDTKWSDGSFLNWIIVHFSASVITPQTLGAGRTHFEDNYVLQVASRGFGAINNTYKMMQEIQRLVNGDPTGIQTVSSIATGIDWAWIDGFQEIRTSTDADIAKGIMPSNDSTFSWYRATGKLYYDKVRS